MRYLLGLLFLAWGSSFIFNFHFDFGKYIFPAIVIGIGINIIFGNCEKCKKYKRDKKFEKYARKSEKYNEKMKNEKGDDINE